MRRSIAIVILGIAGTAFALPGERGQCSAPTEPSMDMRASWSQIRSTSSCWFFSGPRNLGRDDHLGTSARWTRTGDRVELRFGNLSFTGTVSGNRVIVRRESTHTSGSPWRVTETIQGSFTPPDSDACALVARYHYDECERGTPCPGHCHIDATIRFTAR